MDLIFPEIGQFIYRGDLLDWPKSLFTFQTWQTRASAKCSRADAVRVYLAQMHMNPYVPQVTEGYMITTAQNPKKITFSKKKNKIE